MLRVAVDPFDIIDPTSGPPPIKFTWAYDAVRAGEALATIGGGSSRVVSVIDTGLDVNHPEFAGQVARVFDTALRRRGRDGHRRARHLRERSDLGARRQRQGWQGRGRHHQADRGPRLHRRRLHRRRPDQRHRLLDPPGRGRDQHEPRRRCGELHAHPGPRPRGGVLRRRSPHRRGGQQRTRTAIPSSSRPPRSEAAGAGAASGCRWQPPSPTAPLRPSRTTTSS